MSSQVLLSRTYDELQLGDRQVTRGRTVTEADVVNWCAITGDWFSIHSDKVYAASSRFGERIAPGLMVLAFTGGLGVPADSTTIIANYGSDKVRYPHPTFIGDTIHVEIEVIEKRDRDASTGIATFRWNVLNQNGTAVCVSTLSVLMARKDSAAPAL